MDIQEWFTHVLVDLIRLRARAPNAHCREVYTKRLDAELLTLRDQLAMCSYTRLEDVRIQWVEAAEPDLPPGSETVLLTEWTEKDSLSGRTLHQTVPLTFRPGQVVVVTATSVEEGVFATKFSKDSWNTSKALLSEFDDRVSFYLR